MSRKRPAQKDAVENRYEEADIEKLAELINRSQRPLIYAGGGVITAGASDQLLRRWQRRPRSLSYRLS